MVLCGGSPEGAEENKTHGFDGRQATIPQTLRPSHSKRRPHKVAAAPKTAMNTFATILKRPPSIRTIKQLVGAANGGKYSGAPGLPR